MNVVIYLGHPAQYHFSKFFIKNLIKDGHSIKVLIKTKDILEQLLKEDNIEYVNIQSAFRKNSKLSILKAAYQRFQAVYSIAKSFKADVLVGTDSSIAQAAWFMRKPSFTTLEDDYEVIKNLARLTYPFSKHIVVPRICNVGKKWESKKIAYDGYMKLAYLHPSYFTPDKSILDKYGIKNKYCLLRLAKLVAHHDTGIKGLNVELVQNIINIAKQNGYDVFISSEEKIDERLMQYQLKIKQTDIHHILACSSLLVSDSQSMSVEASMLGVPSLRFSDFSGRISVLEELESKYQLTFGIKTSNPTLLIDKTKELLSLKNVSEVYMSRREKMLADKIDVTAFMTWLIENYTQSAEQAKGQPANSEFWNQFK